MHFFKKSPYFSVVKWHRHTTIQKITSSFFFALILFINAVKIFHTHPQSFQKHHVARYFSTGIDDHQKLSTDDHCAICAFNFIKDADLIPISVLVILEQQYSGVVSFKLPAIPSIHYTAISDRAPPSLV